MIDSTKQVFDLIDEENKRQENELSLIASENYMSEDVLKACGSILSNRYTEGYVPKDGKYRRYYGGCHVIDKIEQLAIDRACEVFKCKYANVQPHSGSQANQAVYAALCKPGDTILGMSLDAGGHLTHGHKANASGKFYQAFQYGLTDDGLLDYDDIKNKLYEHKPRLLIVGASAYPRIIDFKKIREIVDEYNKSLYKEVSEFEYVDCKSIQERYGMFKCYLMVDMAHIAGLVATGHHPSPFPYADVITSTTHKTLRSGRGGLILTNDEEITKKIDKAVFPVLQGGPLQNMIAGKAVGFGEALQPQFKEYIDQVLKNIKAMEDVFKARGIKMVSGGSDNHLILLDFKNINISGAQLETTLEKAGIIVNKNAVVNDPRPKMETSGIRLGTACITTRGMKETEAKMIANWICNIINTIINYPDGEENIIENVSKQVKELCKSFPIYKNKTQATVLEHFSTGATAVLPYPNWVDQKPFDNGDNLNRPADNYCYCYDYSYEYTYNDGSK